MVVLTSIISTLFRIYAFLILARVVLSWVMPGPMSLSSQPLIRLLNRSTELLLRPLRRLIPPVGGSIDISPVAALILLELGRALVVTLLLRL